MDLILRMLAYDPKDRIKLNEIRNHKWVISGDRSEYMEIQADL